MHHPSRLFLIGGLLLLGLGACNRSSLERAFAPDPRLQDRSQRPATEAIADSDPVAETSEAAEAAPSATTGDGETAPEPLAAAFPRQAIPLYPQRGTLRWQEIDADAKRGRVRWELAPNDLEALDFYAAALAAANWDIDDTSPDGTIAASKDPWQVRVQVGDGRLTLDYRALTEKDPPDNTAANPDNPDAAEQAAATTPATQANGLAAIASFDDLATAPDPLQKPLQEVAALGVLTPIAPSTQTFAPDRPVSRRTFARWLLAAHERFWRDRPEWQIRPAAPTSEPLFTDIPASDPDFKSIQSLAMAGILPSTLGAENGPKTFDPDAPLTRETLLAWKVPLDWHRGLPNATVTDVRQTWGFQDAERIGTDNLAAVAADRDGGETANLRRLYGYTQLLQPQAPVTRAEAAVALWFFGTDTETGRSAAQLLADTAATAGD